MAACKSGYAEVRPERVNERAGVGLPWLRIKRSFSSKIVRIDDDAAFSGCDKLPFGEEESNPDVAETSGAWQPWG